METNIIYLGDCIKSLQNIPDNSVDCCVTSPPYYALRDYGCEGQIGLEETPEAYIAKLTEVFEQVRRVLKPEGTLWLNIGDSYCGSGKGAAEYPENAKKYKQGTNKGMVGASSTIKKINGGYKPKDLIGIPWMLAFSLRNAGWYLRQDIIWHKPNPMPESVTDRCTKSHEYIFLLSKSKKYYFDYEAIQEEANYDGRKDLMMHGSKKYADAEIMPDAKPNSMAINGHQRWQTKSGHKFGGNKYGQNDDGHFQTYSGKEWKPQTKNCQYDGQEPNTMHLRREEGLPDEVYFVRNKRDVWSVNLKSNKETHFATYPEKLIQPCGLAGCPEKGIVLDPFMGSGTTGIVARKLNRNFIGCELNPEYKAMAERRIAEYGEGLFNQE